MQIKYLLGIEIALSYIGSVTYAVVGVTAMWISTEKSLFFWLMILCFSIVIISTLLLIYFLYKIIKGEFSLNSEYFR